MSTFKCRIPDYHGDDDDSWQEVDAYDEQAAAEKLVEETDIESADGMSEEMDVEVLMPGSGRIENFVVYGETRPHYNAVKLREKKDVES